ncbi:GH17977 [Drosophila grimshawi]|uniref:GH17977 n=1 Tax=Drosophila grimshawi TaxID=7222 RepID=B4K477_DROGR|nr:GH17977 [Drosophila grimshawi]
MSRMSCIKCNSFRIADSSAESVKNNDNANDIDIDIVDIEDNFSRELSYMDVLATWHMLLCSVDAANPD